MGALYDVVRLVHFAAGAAALILFWIPVATRKGSLAHRRAGRLYVWAMGTVITTAIPMSIAFYWRGDWVVATFLTYLAVITYTALWSGRQVLKVKTRPEALRTRFHAAIGVLNGVAAFTVLTLAWTVAPPGFARTLFTVFPIIGFSAAYETWQFFRHTPVDRRWWWYEHLGGMIGSGIAAHTAFGAFGMRQLFPALELGPWALLPWIAPSVVGVTAIALMTRHYRRKFAGAQAVAHA